MAYDKYKKIKGSVTRGSGLERADRYVDDKKKTSPEKVMTGMPEVDESVGSIDVVSKYAENEMKIVNPMNYRNLVSGINCEADEFTSVCKQADALYHIDHDEHLNPGTSANQGFHVINSFKGHPDPELVHRAGLELARRLCGDEFYGKVCTHLNTDNYHNHIIIGAYAIDGTHKFKDEWHLYRKIRQISNEISLEYGLDIINSKGTERRSWSELFQQDRSNEVFSVTKNLKESINEARKNCEDFGEFLDRMKNDGWEIHQAKNRVTYTKDNISLADLRLGNRYTRRGIEESIAREKEYRSKQEAIGLARKLKKELINEARLQRVRIERIYIPRYSKNGVRLSPIIRLLILIKLLIQKIGDAFYNDMIARQLESNIRTANAEAKIAKIDEAIELCAEYGITTKTQLNDMILQAGMNSKTKDYQAARLYQAADLMSAYIDDLKLYDDLKTVMESFGIEDEDFNLPNYSETETRRNRAAFDPMSGKLKRQLYNALADSDYAIPKDSFQTLTREDAESILDFLKNRTGIKPETLMTKEEAEISTARNSIQKRLQKRNEMLFRKYHDEPATSKQVAFIEANITADLRQRLSMKQLKKDQAIRLMNLLKTQKPQPEYTSDETRRPNDYLKNSIRDLKIIYPELKEIKEEELTSESANNISNYYLSKQDTFIEPPKKKKKKKRLDLSEYSEEERDLIIKYRNMLDITNRFGLKTSEDVHVFIDHYNDLLQRADDLSAESRDYSYDYRELKTLQRIIKQVDSPAFVYGTMYEGKAEELHAALESLGDDKNDDLIRLKEDLNKRIKELEDRNPEPVDISSDRFVPPDFLTMNTLIRLKEAVPKYFQGGINLATMTEYETLTLLKTIEKAKELDKEIDRLTKMEQMENRKREKEHTKKKEEETEARTEKVIEETLERMTGKRRII